jgi:hypothetical protein
MYFLGLLTFSGETRANSYYVKIPNETIKRLVFEYINDSIKDFYNLSINLNYFERSVLDMALDGNFKPAMEYVAKEIVRQINLRDAVGKEIVPKIFYLIYLGNCFYFTAESEPHLNQGYADLLLSPQIDRFPILKYAYLIEFKYLNAGFKERTLKTKIKKAIAEAKEQLDIYAQDDNYRAKYGIEPHGERILKKLVVVFHGWEQVYCEEQ